MEALVLPNRNSTALIEDLLVWCGDSGFIAPLATGSSSSLRCNYCYHTASSYIGEYPYVIFRGVSVGKQGTDYGRGSSHDRCGATLRDDPENLSTQLACAKHSRI